MATRTRIAPTPSGFLHRGNALSFLHTAKRAREHGAHLLLRIDDMDRERVRPAYIQDIFDTLAFLQINYDEGPRDAADFEESWSQRLRIPLYESALAQLVSKGALFACTCSRTELQRAEATGYPGTCRYRQIPLDTPGAAWRLLTEDPKPVQIRLPSGKQEEVSLPATQQDFVLRKKDGFPSYQLSSLVDDTHYGVDYIVRGADLWESTIAQLYLARVLDNDAFLACIFEHHPLLRNEKGAKLSKSAGASSLRFLREKGITLEDFLRMSDNAFYP